MFISDFNKLNLVLSPYIMRHFNTYLHLGTFQDIFENVNRYFKNELRIPECARRRRVVNIYVRLTS